MNDPSPVTTGTRPDQHDASRITEIAQMAAQGAGPLAAQIHAFVTRFFTFAAPEDLAAFDTRTLAGMALHAFEMTARRTPGQRKLECFVPDPARHGFGVNGAVLISVNDDRPFLYDSVLAELNAHGFTVSAVFHPIFGVVRDGDGTRTRIANAGEGAPRESVIFVVIARENSEQRLEAARNGVSKVLEDVAAATRDWRLMLERLESAIEDLNNLPPPIAQEELDESIAFLRWLSENHFTFLGCRDYVFDAQGGRHTPIAESGLGLLADPEARVVRRGTDRDTLTAEVRGYLTESNPIIITKANVRSTVHRRVHQDYIGIKRFDASGRLLGERRFVGLFTSAAYYRLPRDIPLLRRKTARVIERAGFPHASHDGKALINVLETFPRDELFQISDDELYVTSLGIMHLMERPRTKTFLRFDRFDRFVSALTFLPRERFSAHVADKIGAILSTRFDGRVVIETPHFPDAPVARIHHIIRRNEGERPTVDDAALQEEIGRAARNWSDDLEDALAEIHAPGRVRSLHDRFHAVFPAGYMETVSAAEAAHDIGILSAITDDASASGPLRFHAYRLPHDDVHTVRVKIFCVNAPAEISAVMPIFDNLGLTVTAEASHTLRHVHGFSGSLTLHAYEARMKAPRALDMDESGPLIEAAFAAAMRGAIENDGFNHLVLAAGLSHRQVEIIRAIARFLRQAGIAFSQPYMEEALTKNADIAREIMKLFEVRFDPRSGASLETRAKNAEAIVRRIEAALADVKSLDDDRILRRFTNAVEAMLRTNAFQTGPDGSLRPALVFKFSSAKLDELPAPRPMAEMFVYCPRVEGIHLRFGKVARGGIRWSDRREDFRTEVLGLVKAQQVKNAVIVPVGAKGGFYPKQLPQNAPREAVQAEGTAAYRIYIDALLDVTDTLGADTVVPPPGVVRHDGDDPYLVVAADKGTATFSDTANGIAVERGFWLGDAFASGGSAGYDHKKMGITARGAWEAVKRHFREMGRNIQREPFSVVGVGDMSGDVFGNGMLLSPHIRLVAAMDHRDIFIDPDPDCAASFAERERLFNLPRSSWADYDKSKISAGGGVFSRALKSIPLSPPMQQLTGIARASATPNEVISALLAADVDLLWFGGIGTFIKATHQSHAQAGDRATDAVRIDAAQVRAKVIGEGANLGLTQAARVEFARAGGRINTDAIDNSAGVDTSDHEVNLKILFAAALAEGRMDVAARDVLLAGMTDEVAGLVLCDNYEQTLALSIAESHGVHDLEDYSRFMRWLEAQGRLDRTVEGLPDETAMRQLQQAGQGLTRPELAVLMAYAKIALNEALLASPVPDDPGFDETLQAYFPAAVRKAFPDLVRQHRLKREIVATVLSNASVNRSGPALIFRMMEASGADAPSVARAIAIVTGAFGLDRLYDRINGLDGQIDARVQISMHADAIRLLRRQTLWVLRNIAPDADLAATISAYRSGLDTFRGTFSTLVTPVEAQSIESRIGELVAAGAALDLAEDIAVLQPLAGMTEIVQLAAQSQVALDAVGGAFFAAGAATGIDRLRAAALAIAPRGHWEQLALERLTDDLYGIQRAVAARALGLVAEAPVDRRAGADAVMRFVDGAGAAIGRAQTLIGELEKDGALSTPKLALAAAQLRDLAG